MNDLDAELEVMLDWQEPEEASYGKERHTFRRAVATPEFLSIYTRNVETMNRAGVRILGYHTDGSMEMGWFSAGKLAGNGQQAAPEAAGATAELGAAPRHPPERQSALRHGNGPLSRPPAPPEPPEWAWLEAPLADGSRLYEHQRAGAKKLLSQRGTILAYEMGTGKTRTALMAARKHAESGAKVLVVAPARLLTNWQREAEVTRTSIEVTSWGKGTESPNGDYVLIADEAHYAQNPGSARTKRFLALAERASAVFLLTGTPMKNGRPANLWPLLVAIGHPLGADRRAYEARYCDAKWTVFGGHTKDGTTHFRCRRCGSVNNAGRTWPGSRKRFCSCGEAKTLTTVWDTSGAKHTDALHAALAPALLRRTKAQCLDLPAKTRVLAEVEPTPDMRDAYRAALDAMKARYLARVETGEISDNGEALAMLTFIRQAASRAKLDYTIEAAEEVIEEGSAVVIFTEYVETARHLAQHFGAVPLVGDTSRADGDALVADFQAGKSRVFIATSASGGTGLTLTAGSTVILHDRPLTPGDANQAEDRLHRLGQHWPVTSIWPQAFDVDRKIDELLERKEQTTERVLSGDYGTVRGTGSIKAATVLTGLFRADAAGRK